MLDHQVVMAKGHRSVRPPTPKRGSAGRRSDCPSEADHTAPDQMPQFTPIDNLNQPPTSLEVLSRVVAPRITASERTGQLTWSPQPGKSRKRAGSNNKT